eukprot:UN33774
MVTLTGFVAGIISHSVFPVISWEYGVYAVLRALLGPIRMLVPLNLQPSGRLMFGIANGILPFFITFNIQYVPRNYRPLFTDTQDADIECYKYMYNRPDINLPPCWPRCHKSPDCYWAFIRDFGKRLVLSVKFYIKFYSLFMLLNPTALVKNPIGAILGLFERSVKSSLFMAGTFHFGERFHCFYRRFLKFVYRTVFNVSSDVPLPSNTTFSRALFLLNAGFWGWFWVGFESPGRHADLALFTIWKEVEMVIRMLY